MTERRRIEETVRAAEAEKARLREADLQKKLDDTLGKLNETQRQLEQGSQQLQGEVLELLLEEELAASFPFDAITEVKKGARGADALHRVMTRLGQEAGLILWEAKRAQKWSPQWPAKLKQDMREAGADTGRHRHDLVSRATGRTGQLFGFYDDVWVTTPGAAIAMAAVLRVGLVDAHKARMAGARKGEKMEAVYDYLTSPQFAHKLRAVYDAFKKMREELESERTVMQQRWRRREKQIGDRDLAIDRHRRRSAGPGAAGPAAARTRATGAVERRRRVVGTGRVTRLRAALRVVHLACRYDSSLVPRLRNVVPLAYSAGASPADDVVDHVRAASAVRYFGGPVADRAGRRAGARFPRQGRHH